jgi:hypothetical protein
MAAKQPSREMLDDMMKSERKVPADKLDALRAGMREVRDIEHEMRDCTDRLKELSGKRNTILQKTLPDLLQGAGVPSISIEPEGNLPGMEAVVQPFYYANIAADWDEERREKAFAYLRTAGMGDLIKMILTIEFGLGTAKLQKSVAAALRKLKAPFTLKKGVPHQTLTAWVRERYQKGKPFAPADLEIIGATVTTVVKLKEKK